MQTITSDDQRNNSSHVKTDTERNVSPMHFWRLLLHIHLNLGDWFHSAAPANIFVVWSILLSIFFPMSLFLRLLNPVLVICDSISSLEITLFYECFSIFRVREMSKVVKRYLDDKLR